MAENTNISWADDTRNPWASCTQVSPGCAHCYMFVRLRQLKQEPGRIRRTQTWDAPLRFERKAALTQRRRRVFTCSWSDWFHAEADGWRDEAWATVRRCPRLDFLILTKRPERIAAHLPSDWGRGYPNVWLGVSIENNRFVDAGSRGGARRQPLPDSELDGKAAERPHDFLRALQNEVLSPERMTPTANSH